jgi:hypothetical protein
MHGVMFPVRSVTARPSACQDDPRPLTSKVLYDNRQSKTGRDLHVQVQLLFSLQKRGQGAAPRPAAGADALPPRRTRASRRRE